MASSGDKVARKVDELITLKWGLLDNGVFQGSKAGSSTLTVYDEADVSFVTPSITEPIAGIYEVAFTPDAAGQWTAKLVETSIPAAAAWSFDVVATVLGDQVDAIQITVRLVGSAATGAGTDTTLVDSGLTEATVDHWKGALIRMTSGTAANIGLTRRVTGFTPGTDTLTFFPALNAATASSDGYELLPGVSDPIIVDTYETISGSTTTQIRTDSTKADNYYDGMAVKVTQATSDQALVRNINSYDNTNGAFNVDLMNFAPAAGATVEVIAVPGQWAAERALLDTGYTAGRATNLDNLDVPTSDAATPSEVNTEVDTALSDIRLDELILNASAAPGAGSLAEDFMGATFVTATDSLEALRDRIDNRLPDVISLANINTEVDTALSDIRLDELILNASAAPGTGSLAEDFMGSSFVSVTDSLEALRNNVGTAGAGLTAQPWNAAWDTEVESEVNDALDTAIAELGVAAPSATPTLRTAAMLLYMALRNRINVTTSGAPDVLEITNDAGVVIASKQLTDDGSDYSETELA